MIVENLSRVNKHLVTTQELVTKGRNNIFYYIIAIYGSFVAQWAKAALLFSSKKLFLLVIWKVHHNFDVLFRIIDVTLEIKSLTRKVHKGRKDYKCDLVAKIKVLKKFQK